MKKQNTNRKFHISFRLIFTKRFLIYKVCPTSIIRVSDRGWYCWYTALFTNSAIHKAAVHHSASGWNDLRGHSSHQPHFQELSQAKLWNGQELWGQRLCEQCCKQPGELFPALTGTIPMEWKNPLICEGENGLWRALLLVADNPATLWTVLQVMNGEQCSCQWQTIQQLGE